MQIIISMAGLGNRFKERGFRTPKHLIKINNKTLIEYAIDSLDISGNYIFIIRKIENIDNSELISILNKYNSQIIEIDYVTEGPASSAYLAKDYLDLDQELIITNCDQILEWNSKNFLLDTRNKKLDCSVLTYLSENPKNSFISYDKNNNVLEIKEKCVISNSALVGIHYFKKSKLFIKSYEEIYQNKIKENNEYYLSTVCNNLIKNYQVGYVNLNETNGEKYHSTGTPDCYFKYLRYIGQLNTSVLKINDMTRGWFVGDFMPSAFRTKEFEVGYLIHKKGEIWDVHYHEHLTEINLLIEGKMILNDIEINKNEIFIINKNEIACPIFLEDTYIICIKVPSVIGDKVII